MFKKKDYIKVRGIGKIMCKPELNVEDVQSVCMLASMVPFFDINDDNKNSVTKKEHAPELDEYAFWSSLILVATDYKVPGYELWSAIHTTDITTKLAVYYCAYMNELYTGAMERIYAKAKSLEPLNEEALFNGMAKSLENVDIGQILEIANTISQMDGREIVKAAAELNIP